MQNLLILVAAFVLDFISTATATQSLLALEKRKGLQTANWGLVTNLAGGGALLLAAWLHSLPAFAAGCVGAWLADYVVVSWKRKKEHEAGLDAARRPPLDRLRLAHACHALPEETPAA